jgi:alkylation response protein AidB-like acyl-CoA dehydrogenase
MTGVDLSGVSLLRPEEVQHFQEGLHGFLESTSSPAEVRRLMATESGYERPTWERACAELGLGGLAIEEQYGGQGAGTVALSAAFEELGGSLSGLPALSTLGLAVPALRAAADEEALARHLPAIAEGRLTAALLWPRRDDRVVVDEAGRLDGRVGLVLDGHTADLLLVVADGPEGASLRSVAGTATGVEREPLPTFDLTRKLAAVTFDGAQSDAVGAPGAGGVILQEALRHAGLCVASEQLGGMACCLGDAVGYAKTRVQFGRYIGSFQAIKHRCADLLVETESARSAVHYAAWATQERPDAAPVAVALAQAVAADGYVDVATATMQVFGGIGFTWEHHTHLHLKRAKAMQHLLGPSAAHRRTLEGALGL